MRVALKILNQVEEILIASLIALATLIIFLAVVHRYTLSHLAALVLWARQTSSPWISEILYSTYLNLLSFRLTWAQELCIFLFIWMAKFGAAYGVRTGIHVGVDIVVNMLKEPWRRRTLFIGLLCGAVFTAFVGVVSTYLVAHLFHSGQLSAVLEIPMWWVYLCLPLGSFLMCFRFLEVAYHFSLTGELPKHNEAINFGTNGKLSESGR
ncbi:MAG: TRAP transporter small permease [Hyphomicrobium sp.]